MLSIKEQQTLDLPKVEFEKLARSMIFERLRAEGVLSLVRSKSSPYGVRASFLVGNAILENGTPIEVVEKVPGTLRALLKFSDLGGMKELALTSVGSTTGDIIETIASRFLRELGGYIARGRRREYRRILETAQRPKGKLAIQDTVRLRARGHSGLVTRREILTADVLVNQLLACALRVIEPLYRSNVVGSETASLARLYYPLFSDVSHWIAEHGTYYKKSSLFETAAFRLDLASSLSAALSFARPLVLHLGVFADDSERLPSSFFLNLQSLFEDACRRVWSGYSTLKVLRGETLALPLFRHLPDAYVASPDLVLVEGQAVQLVADCKYKQFHGLPSHDDVYQLVAHCSAMRCARGLLIYAGEEYSLLTLGTTVSGVTVQCAQVRPAELGSDIARLETELLPMDSSAGEQLAA